MKRVVWVALFATGVGLLAFGAPAEGATGHAGTMVGASSATYRYSKGVCGTSGGDGTFNIEVGDTITWTNCSNAGHTVTGEGFGSTTVLGPGDSTPAYTFNAPGTYPYHCDIHPSMTGAVNVTGPAPTAPTAPTVPITTATTQPPATSSTTTSTTVRTTTSTTNELDAVFGGPTSSTTPTTVDPTVTTRALGEGGNSSASAGMVAMLILGLGSVGTAGALVIRRMRGGPTLPS